MDGRTKVTSVVWVAHGNVLFRCTPEQLRPASDAEKMITETDLEELTGIDLEELINELFPEIADVFCFLSDYESETKKDA